MPKISRRGLLTAAVGAALVGTSEPGASAALAPAPGGASPQPASSSASLGKLSASVDMVPLQDVVAINYAITNAGARAETCAVSYIDEVTGLASRGNVVHLSSGGTHTGVLYGSLNRDFTLNVSLSDGTSLRLGPVGKRLSSRRVNGRPVPVPLPQPGRG